MAKRPVSLEATMRAVPPAQDGPADITVGTPAAKVVTVEKLTVYVPKAAAKRLKQMALDHDKRVNDFLQEGVDLMLSRYGQPSLADLEKR